MRKSLEYIVGLSTHELTRMVTTNKSRYSADELNVANGELKARGIDITSEDISDNTLVPHGYYNIDEKTTGQYMLDEMGCNVAVPTNNDNNPIAMRHMLTTDVDITTFLMWLQAFSPLIAGALVGSNLISIAGMESFTKFLTLVIFDALFGLADIFVLNKHGYTIRKLIFWAVWLPPVYMKMRSKMLREKNMEHVVWIIAFVVMLLI